jgi:hypothetical protein
MEHVSAGDLIVVKDRSGQWLRKRALGPVQHGGSFPVIWACREEEWQAAKAEGREPQGMPWPVEDVRFADNASA